MAPLRENSSEPGRLSTRSLMKPELWSYKLGDSSGPPPYTLSAYDKFIAPNFIHHNQYFKGDRESLMKAMEEAHKKSPNQSIEVKHVYQDGNTVITHSQVLRRKPNSVPIAVVH